MSGQDGRLGKEEHNRVYRELVLPNVELDSYTPQERPVAVVLAGQPGAGKGSLKRAVEAEFDHDIFVVDPDEQRGLHPEAERWQKESPYGWSQKTNADAGGFAGSLRGEGVERRINLLVDTTLGGADGAIKTIRGLQEAGYQVEIRAVGAHELESRVGIDRRFTDGIDRQGVGRDVPLAFHDKVYADLPDNLDKVSAATGVRVRIYDRDDPANAVFDSQRDPGSPSAALREIRDGRLQAPETTQRMRIEAQEQADWHRDPQDRLVQSGKMEPETLEALQRERVEANKPAISARDSEAWSTLDELVRDGAQPARAPIPGFELPPLGRAGATAGLAGLGAAAAAYDAKETGDRINTALAQDNPSAVRSEATHFTARGVGGAAAVFTPAAVGVSGGPAVALAVADAYLLTEAFDRGAKWLDKERVVHQTDREGVNWEFTGRQWIREDLKADLRDDGVDQVRGQNFAALPDKARELGYLASVEAVGQAIGRADPRNPFELPANVSDAPSNQPSPWRLDAQSGEWTRTRYVEIDPTDPRLPDRQVPETAKPERAAELNRQASQIIDENIARGPAALAAQYEIGHKRNGFDQFGEVPVSVQTALNPNTLEASNGKQYVRDAQGQWSHEGAPASPNHALELDTTRERLLPALEQHQGRLAAMPEWQPLTPEQQDRANLRQLYADYGVNPNPERFEAAYQAVKETREAQGINAEATSLALEPRPAGGYDVNTPIQHLQIEGDGVVRVAATTTAVDIQRVETALKSEPRAIDAPSAQERNAREQAQREANRAGLSQDEAQPALRGATPSMSGSGGRSGKADEQDQELLNETPAKRSTNGSNPEPTASVPLDFAPSQQGLRDIRDPQHEGYDANREMVHRAKLFETQNGIPHGPHSERLGASMLAFAVENGFRYQDVSLEKNQDTGQVQLKHARYGQPTQYFPADLASMSSQPIEATSQRINEAVSKHNANPAPSLERTQEQAQALGAYSFEDKLMFARVRGGTPGHISDDHVGLAALEAKKAGMDANNIGQVSMVGDNIRIARSGPDGKTVLVDVNAPAQPLQATIDATNTFNQEQVLAKQLALSQQQNPQPDGPDGPNNGGPTMGPRTM